jgi:hypothetical protein
VFDLQVDPSLTSLADENGRPIPVTPRAGRLTIRAPSAPMAVEAEGAEVRPGELAVLGVETFEPIPLAGGQVLLRWDPRFLGGTPAVRMDPRYGRSTFRVDRLRRGVMRVAFQSPDRSLNTVPGQIVAIDVPTPANGPVGLRAPVTLDPNESFLLSAQGRRIRLKIENGVLEFR